MHIITFKQVQNKNGVQLVISSHHEGSHSAIEHVVAQKLKAAALVACEQNPLNYHPLDVGAKIFINALGSDNLVGLSESGELVEQISHTLSEMAHGHSAESQSVLSNLFDKVGNQLQIVNNVKTLSEVSDSVEYLESESEYTINVDISDANEVVGGLGTPSVLAAFAAVTLFRNGLESDPITAPFTSSSTEDDDWSEDSEDEDEDW